MRERLNRLSFAAAITLVVAVTVNGQKGPNLELGFQPQKLYQFTDLDSINLFNGNLSVSLPIGPEYRVGGPLKYQLTLVYNSKVWDYETLTTSQGNITYDIARPNLRSNAGLGWRLSLGQLLPKTDTTNTYPSEGRGAWVYEGPAGDEHAFSDVVAGEGSSVNPYNAEVLFDGQGLRMVKMADGGRSIEMPSGERHIFRNENGRWRLKEINDRFSNWIRITYTLAASGADQSWTITDSVNRSQIIQFVAKTALADTIYQGQVVDKITLEGVNGVDFAYEFIYLDFGVPHGCGHQPQGPFEKTTPEDTQTTTFLPFLTSIERSRTHPLPDETLYSLAYHVSDAPTSCEQAALASMKLPTGGTASYQYQQYYLPTDKCIEPGWADHPVGLRTRTTPDGTSDYVQDVGPTYGYYSPLPQNQPGPCGMNDAGQPLGYPLPRRWSRTSVLSPTDNGVRKRVDNFFALTANSFEDSFVSTRPWLTDLGPVTGYPGVTGAPSRTAGNVALIPSSAATTTDVISIDEPESSDGRFLSSRVFEGCPPSGAGPGCAAVQEGYARYDKGVFGPRVRTSATLSPNDLSCGSGGCVTRSLSTDFDGAGHYRTISTSSNIPASPSSTDFKQYASWNTTLRRDPTVPWILGLFTESRRTVGASTVVSQYCFDGSTGFLTQRRSLRNQGREASDVIEFLAATSKGEIATEKSYGGDNQAVPTDSHCSNLGNLTPKYWIENSYVAGVLATSRYRKSAIEDMGFYRADRSVDPFTGLVTVSRDSAQRATSYAYDGPSLRLTSVTPPQGAATFITYTDATSGTGAHVDVSTLSDVLQRYGYDGLGRVVRESELRPGAIWFTTETTYDSLGRRKSVSVPTEGTTTAPSAPINATRKTTFTYDALDRLLTVTAPDGSIGSIAYPAIWKRERKSFVMTPSNLQEATTKEQYDSLGRLRSVAERSGPSGSPGALPPTAEVTTTYGYDAADRLTSVVMSDPTSGKSQVRTFEYDGRGFLGREVPVESSAIGYSKFDARGHAGERSVGTADSLFDLRYEFDAAERLTKVLGRNPESVGPEDAFRVMKEFTYCTASTASNFCQGKLASATRYNYRVSPAQAVETQARGTLLVTEDYEYGDLAGRLTTRKTTISSISPFTGQPVALREISQSVSYNELGLPGNIKYPMCADCGIPPGIPDRQLQPTYSRGRTTSLPGFATGLTYAPSGQLTSLTHPAGGIVDAYAPDSDGMARPKSITFGRELTTATTGGFYAECVPPAIQSQPANQTVASGQSATLAVTVTGSAPVTYQWYTYNVSTGATTTIAGATSSSLAVTPTSTSGYFVRASNVCRFADSNLATLTVSGSCKTPSISSMSDGRTSTPAGTMTVSAAGGTALTLSVIAAGSDPLTYQWSRVTPQAQTLGTTPAITVSIASSSQYKVIVSNGCGSVTGIFNVTVPLPAPAFLSAVRSGANAITVSWQASAGAATYVVQRRSTGAGFEGIASVTTTQFVDSGRSGGSSYVYRVHALDASGGSASSPSNVDIATTLTFTSVSPGMPFSSQPLTELLASVNALRVVVGWSAVSWPQILPAGLPPPAAGSPLFGAHIAALRNEFNQLLSAVGAGSGPYTDPQLSNSLIRASHITELQQRGQ